MSYLKTDATTPNNIGREKGSTGKEKKAFVLTVPTIFVWDCSYILHKWQAVKLTFFAPYYVACQNFTLMKLSQSTWKFQQRQPIPTHYLPEMLRLILKSNFFHVSGKHYLQDHGTAMGTKTAVLIPLPIFSWHILKQQF